MVEDTEVEWKRRKKRSEKSEGGGWADGVARMKHLHGSRAKPR